MNADLKEKWLKALRSGDYNQGQGKLKITNKHTGHTEHCCLGVLCEIAGFKEEMAPDGNRIVHCFVDDRGYKSASLPTGAMNEIFQIAAIKFSQLVTDNDSMSVDPMTMLGVHDHTFNDIADYIEEYIE